MPEKPLTVATYAAGASLAAIALVYVFGPTYLFDQAEGGKAGTKAVGLVNPANDCFINSILQATAGLPDLRRYLIRELHRRKLDGPSTYELNDEDYRNEEEESGTKVWKLEGLRGGLVTKALKDMLDKLNERPIYRKTIAATDFIRALEVSFRTRLSRQQQDAQEFLQVVLERLCDEYHAGRKARLRTKRVSAIGLGVVCPPSLNSDESTQSAGDQGSNAPPNGNDAVHGDSSTETSDEEGFPFEGKIESVIKCEACNFSPKPSVSTFVTLTLNVPETSPTTLNECFDGVLKIERIDDYKCDRCRLTHALEVKQKQLARGCLDESARARLEQDMEKIQRAIEDDPETIPEDVELPDLALAPKRRIQRHMRIASFPKILAIHLSRSLYSAVSLSTKNDAKVVFPEILPLGGLLEQRKYRLLTAVMHKGVHHNGHYETFRRQMVSQPFSTSVSFGSEGVYSVQNSPRLSAMGSPRLSALRPPTPSAKKELNPQSPRISALTLDNTDSRSSSASSRSRRSLSVSTSRKSAAPTSAPAEPMASTETASGTIVESTLPANVGPPKAPSEAEVEKLRKRQKKRESKWWRISDDRVKDSTTREVLGMQREVYLLFYELDTRDDS